MYQGNGWYKGVLLLLVSSGADEGCEPQSSGQG